MSDDQELDDGLAAFEQLGREMTETNRLLRSVQTSQTERNRQETTLSAELQTALKQATGAAQKAIQASKAELRSNLIVVGIYRPSDASDGRWRGILARASSRNRTGSGRRISGCAG